MWETVVLSQPGLRLTVFLMSMPGGYHLHDSDSDDSDYIPDDNVNMDIEDAALEEAERLAAAATAADDHYAHEEDEDANEDNPESLQLGINGT